MKKLYILFLLVINLNSNSFSQNKIWNNWYFSYHFGITFNTPDGSPTALLNNAFTCSLGGSASISDKSGNFLFATDGYDTTFNRNQQLMPTQIPSNSYGGGPYPIIVPFPEDTTKYYIFYTGCDFGCKNHNYLSYSVVDMTLDGGLGNIQAPSFTNLPLSPHSDEESIAVRHRNGKDFWVINHEIYTTVNNINQPSNRLFAYHITKDGIDEYNPTISSVGPTSIGYYVPYDGTFGIIKVSQNCKYIALLRIRSDYNGSDGVHFGDVILYQFNNSTGEILNPVIYKGILWASSVSGIEFSPDSKKLYISYQGILDNGVGIVQIDLQKYDSLNILKSAISILNGMCGGNNGKANSLQIGPDFKIYCSAAHPEDSIFILKRQNYLSVINKPNLTEASCSFSFAQIDLKMDTIRIVSYLPLLIAGTLGQDPIIQLSAKDTIICGGGDINLSATVTTFNEDELKPDKDTLWTGPNGWTSKLINPIIKNATADNSGWYYFTFTFNNVEFYDSIYIKVNAKPQVFFDPSKKIYLCGSDSKIITVTSDSVIRNYLWSTGDTTQSIKVNKEGIYTITLTDMNGCTNIDSVTVLQVEPPKPTIVGDTFLCPNTIGKITLEQDYSSYLWNTGETTNEITINKAGEYYVTVIDSNGCTGISNMLKVKYFTFEFELPSEIIFYKTRINHSKERIATLYNTSDYSVTLKSVSIKTSPNIYTLLDNFAGRIIKSKDSLEIQIQFTPKDSIEYQDSLVIEVENPCEKYYSIFLDGIGIKSAKALIWMPDTTGNIGDIHYTIPIYAKIITDENKIINLEYNADIRFDAEMYYPRNYTIANKTNEAIDYSNVDYYEKQLQLNCPDIAITNEQTIIGQMTGIILVGVNKETPLHIQSFSFLGDSVEVETQDGKLTTNSCAKDIMSIRTFQPTELEILQSSNDTKARILSEETGNFTLKIYDIRGVEIEKILWNSKDKQDIEIKLQSEKYPQGIYNAILISPENVKSKAFVVVK